MDEIKITNDPLSLDEARTLVTSPSAGAISVFIGKIDIQLNRLLQPDLTC